MAAKSLTQISSPTLWAGPAVIINKTEYKFDTEDQIRRFALHNDVNIIKSELLSCCTRSNYHHSIDKANAHKTVLLETIDVLSAFTSSESIDGIIELLVNDVSPSLDILIKLSSIHTIDVVKQAKGLVTLFILKYKQ